MPYYASVACNGGDCAMSGNKRKNPYKEPRKYFEVPDRFRREYQNPEVEIVKRPEMRDMVAIAELWDREYDMPIQEGTIFWGTKGDFYSLYHAVMRYVSRNERELLDQYLHTDNEQ